MHRPVILKISVLLIVIYAILELIRNVITSFFVSIPGFFVGQSYGLDNDNLIRFIISGLPLIFLLWAAYKIWQLSKVGFYLNIIIVVAGFLMILSSFGSLTKVISQITNEDILYLNRKSDGIVFVLDENGAQMDNINVLRVRVVDNLFLALVRLVGPICLLSALIGYKPISKR